MERKINPRYPSKKVKELCTRIAEIQVEGLSNGEYARLVRCINSLEIIVDRIESGYYRNFKEEES